MTKLKRESKPDLRPISYSLAYANFVVGCIQDNAVNKPTYTESHHILPRCRGGGDEAGNLVRLTGSQHFTAHRLLSLANQDCYKLKSAVAAFVMKANVRELTEDQFDLARKAASVANSLRLTGLARLGLNPFQNLAVKPMDNPVNRKAKSEELKLQHKDLEFVALIAAGRKRYNADPKSKLKRQAVMADRYSKPGAIDKVARQFRAIALQPDHHNKARLHCPHCLFEGVGLGNMLRWHFDCCLEKPDNVGLTRKEIRAKRLAAG